MYVVKNSERALFVALIPLAVVHAVLLAMALLATKAMPSQAIMPPPDKILLHFAGRLALDGVLLFGGHLALRQFNICSRAAYALIGGAMAATSYLLAMRNGLLMFSVPVGSEITAGLLPAAAGVLAGFLYGQFAGLVTVAAAPRVAVPAQPNPRARPVCSTVPSAFAPQLALLPSLQRRQQPFQPCWCLCSWSFSAEWRERKVPVRFSLPRFRPRYF
jgi:hypothetical protein